jgi:hypothetical protein
VPLRTLPLIVILAFFSIGLEHAAADPRATEAARAFEAVGVSPSKLKTYCELNQLMDRLTDGDEDLDALATPDEERSVDRLLDELGPEFKQAWKLSESLDGFTGAEFRTYEAAFEHLKGSALERKMQRSCLERRTLSPSQTRAFSGTEQASSKSPMTAHSGARETTGPIL